MLPLEGTTVVSVEQAVAGPFATRQLADLGARVIKVERQGPGDFARGYDRTVRGMSSHFVWLNRSKESIALDLKSTAGSEAMRALVDVADVFVQNLAPGAVENLGLGAEDLRRRKPELIHASISGYGKGGDYTTKKAYDLMVQCEAGLVSITGTPETPSKVGISVADIAAGMYCFSGILTALLRRGRSGEGATLEISMLEALGEWMGYPLNFAMYGGTQPARSGGTHPAIAPYGPFRCAEGEQVFLGLQNDREWSAFCLQVLERPDLVDDERFRGNSLRVEHQRDLARYIEESFADQTAARVVERLEGAGIANAFLRDVLSFAEHPQLRARDRWRQVDSPVGMLDVLMPPATLDGDEPVMQPIPGPGEHTSAILTELGLVPPDDVD